jgi:hypothetical protein
MADPTYTVTNLFQMALEELGVQDTGQPVSAEDAAVLAGRWPSIAADLNARDVGYFDLTEISAADLLPLAQVLAYNCYSAFSISDTASVVLLEKKGGKDGEAERTLKNVRRLRRSRQTMRTDQFARHRYGRRSGY